MYRVWLNESEYQQMKNDIQFHIIMINKDHLMFVECATLSDWQSLNEVLISNLGASSNG